MNHTNLQLFTAYKSTLTTLSSLINMESKPYTGICGQLLGKGRDLKYGMVTDALQGWSKASGSLAYPVPSDKPNMTDEEMYDSAPFNLGGLLYNPERQYGRDRIELAKHMYQYFSDKMEWYHTQCILENYSKEDLKMIRMAMSSLERSGIYSKGVCDFYESFERYYNRGSAVGDLRPFFHTWDLFSGSDTYPVIDRDDDTFHTLCSDRHKARQQFHHNPCDEGVQLMLRKRLVRHIVLRCNLALDYLGE